MVAGLGIPSQRALFKFPSSLSQTHTQPHSPLLLPCFGSKLGSLKELRVSISIFPGGSQSGKLFKSIPQGPWINWSRGQSNQSIQSNSGELGQVLGRDNPSRYLLWYNSCISNMPGIMVRGFDLYKLCSLSCYLRSHLFWMCKHTFAYVKMGRCRSKVMRVYLYFLSR